MDRAGCFDMRSLLERAGFSVRGATRADCVHCEGGSRGTVAFTLEVAFCHRCKWRANVVMLARELGLLEGNSEAASALRQIAQERAQRDVELNRFDQWRDARIREASDRYRSLSKVAIRAEEVLREYPTCEEAWEAMARFYHQKAKLSAALDWLMFAKASDWLEADSTATEVFATWRADVA
jgi:hypothetical protein